MNSFAISLALSLVSATAVIAGNNIPGSDIQTPAGSVLLSTGPKGSKFYQLEAPDATYAEEQIPVYLLDLTAATSYNQGYDNAALIGDKYIENFDYLMHALLGDAWWEPAVEKLVNAFLDWQWNDYLSVQLPEEYQQELAGMSAASADYKYKSDIGVIAGRGITLANFPGTISNIKYILQDESPFDKSAPLTKEQVAQVLKMLESTWKGLTCSMFGAWGSRTEGGRLFTGRNLDWLKDAGISKNKLITVHHPPQGYVHATFGWAGIWGAITGISSQGLTVHEANLESDDITFSGFPWVLRLRHVMAHSRTIDEALQIWQSAGGNTVGFNHGIGSAADNEAVVMETMKGNTAVFHANDPREQFQMSLGQQIGQAREEAVYRTNHGYDQYTIEHYLDYGTNAYNSSVTRYLLFPEMFDNYKTEGTAITYIEAVNITAVVGNKGMDSLYECSATSSGSNVLSVTYDPSNLMAYAAWENGAGDNWSPAACNTYLVLDMKQWLAPEEAQQLY